MSPISSRLRKIPRVPCNELKRCSAQVRPREATLPLFLPAHPFPRSPLTSLPLTLPSSLFLSPLSLPPSSSSSPLLSLSRLLSPPLLSSLYKPHPTFSFSYPYSSIFSSLSTFSSSFFLPFSNFLLLLLFVFHSLSFLP